MIVLAATAPLAAANIATMNVTITNAGPALGTVSSFPTPIVPAANGTVAIDATLRATDANGWRDLVATASLTGPAEAAAADRVTKSGTITITSVAGDPTAGDVKASFSLAYWNLPGTYTITFSVNDAAGAAASTAALTKTTTFTFSELVALALDSSTTSLAFAALAPGGTNEASLRIWNVGNVPIDTTIDTTGLTGVDAIGPTALAWSLTSAGSGSALPANGKATAGTAIPVGETSWKDLHWDLTVPNVRAGTYTGNLQLGAVKSS